MKKWALLRLRTMVLQIMNNMALKYPGFIFHIKIIKPAFDKAYREYESKAKQSIEKSSNKKVEQSDLVFPKEVISNLHQDVGELCQEFNFSYVNKKKYSCMLILRRLIPLAIVRKFQQENKEENIKNGDDYLNTKALLGKLNELLSEKKALKEVLRYKILTDSAQHSYIFKPEMTDIKGAALAIRLLLGNIFPK